MRKYLINSCKKRLKVQVRNKITRDALLSSFQVRYTCVDNKKSNVLYCAINYELFNIVRATSTTVYNDGCWSKIEQFNKIKHWRIINKFIILRSIDIIPSHS